MPSRGHLYPPEAPFTLERMKIAIEDFFLGADWPRVTALPNKDLMAKYFPRTRGYVICFPALDISSLFFSPQNNPHNNYSLINIRTKGEGLKRPRSREINYYSTSSASYSEHGAIRPHLFRNLSHTSLPLLQLG